MMDKGKINAFFTYARERYSVFGKKELGLDRSDWTHDPILQSWYFTNIFREDDRVTRWFAQNVRDRLCKSYFVLPATVLFRWFNRPEIGQTIFGDNEGQPLFDNYIMDNDIDHFISAVRSCHPKGPYVNGAYIIKGYDGYDKLEGVSRAFHSFYQKHHLDILSHDVSTMEGMTKWLSTFDQLGMFMAYEIACDLRWTHYLENAPDRLTWANPGPGARRGISRLYHNHPDANVSTQQCIDDMRELLVISHDTDFWSIHWPYWEMREVEHTLCEFDKYERIRQGGRGKRRYT